MGYFSHMRARYPLKVTCYFHKAAVQGKLWSISMTYSWKMINELTHSITHSLVKGCKKLIDKIRKALWHSTFLTFLNLRMSCLIFMIWYGGISISTTFSWPKTTACEDAVWLRGHLRWLPWLIMWVLFLTLATSPLILYLYYKKINFTNKNCFNLRKLSLLDSQYRIHKQ